MSADRDQPIAAELADELENFREIARYLKPSSGEIPQIPGVDIAGLSMPLREAIGGDHIIYIDFDGRYDLTRRIGEAQQAGKTAVALEVERRRPLSPADVADVAASFECAAVDVLVARASRALREQRLFSLAVVGGVAANRRLRRELTDLGSAEGFRAVFPPPELCTDNAAMIGAAGARLLARGEAHGLALNAFSRVPLGTAPWKAPTAV